MQLFEVFIPSSDPDGIDITARLRAQSWTDALKQGLARLGDTTDIKHVMCDIREDGIAVTEPKSGRVFRIREVAEEGAAQAATPPPVAASAPVGPPPAPPAAPVAAPLPVAAPAAARHVAAPAAPHVATPVAPPRTAALAASPAPAAKAKPPTPPPAPPAEAGDASAAARNAPLVGRGKESASRGIDDLLGDMFLAVGKIYELKSVNTAADFLLELAMKAVAVESGRVIVASINKTELTFVAARGPKAELVKDIHLNVGQGIVGFAIQEGVAIAVSDAERDPRFYAGISQRIGSPTHSVACAPAQKDGRVYGALQLINKKDGATFTADDMSVLDYLAGQFADYVINTGQTDAG